MISSGGFADSVAGAVDSGEFLFPGSSPSVLLIHGLTGTPYEMRFVGERLAAIGIRAMGVRLAGHCRPPEELGSTNHEQWYESVVAGFERLRAFGDPVVVVGLSAGAVLAAQLAADQGEAVAAIALLGSAFFLTPASRFALAVAGQLGRWTNDIYLRRPGSDIRDDDARRIHPGTSLMPLAAAMSLVSLSAIVRRRLVQIRQPALVMHGRLDHVCPWHKNVKLLIRHLGSAKRRIVILERSFHVITVDIEKERVATEFLEFIGPFRNHSSHRN